MELGEAECERHATQLQSDEGIETRYRHRNGGYVSAPVLTIAKILRIPYVLHEQNSIPAGRIVFLKGAEKVFISYDVSRSYFSKKTSLYLTGNPVRPDFYHLDYESARESIGLDSDAFAVLVMGGSLEQKRSTMPLGVSTKTANGPS